MIHTVDKHIVFLWSSESCFMLENGQVVSCQDASPFQKLQLLAGAKSKLQLPLLQLQKNRKLRGLAAKHCSAAMPSLTSHPQDLADAWIRPA